MIEPGNDYYVYTYAYPDGKVFYVGKGHGNRIDHHEREAKSGVDSEKCAIIRQIWADGKQVLKKKIYENLSEEDAFSLVFLTI